MPANNHSHKAPSLRDGPRRAPGVMKDLLGDPISFPDLPAKERAERLYAEADAAPRGSPERMDLYRRAALAQQQAEAGTRLAQTCAERVALPDRKRA